MVRDLFFIGINPDVNQKDNKTLGSVFFDKYKLGKLPRLIINHSLFYFSGYLMSYTGLPVSLRSDFN